MATPEKYRNKYRVRWTDHLGKRQCKLYETHREAQRALRQFEADVDAIKAGAKAAPPEPHTFEELFDYWLKYRAVLKASEKDDQSIIRVHLRPAFGKLKLTEFGLQHLDAFKARRSKENAKTTCNILTLLNTMLGVARDLKWLVDPPRIRKPRLEDDELRFLPTEEDILKVLTAARRSGEDAYVLYATAIYTGMRQGELAGLHWADVDLDRKRITVRRSFKKGTKTGKIRHLPIFDVLLPILRDWKQFKSGPLVFPNKAGEMHAQCAWIFSDRFYKILDDAGYERPVNDQKWRHFINFHSLRHTFASQWIRRGGRLEKLQKLMGHESIQMTMRYAHLAPDAFEEEYGRFAAIEVPERAVEVAEVVEPKVKVTPKAKGQGGGASNVPKPPRPKATTAGRRGQALRGTRATRSKRAG